MQVKDFSFALTMLCGESDEAIPTTAYCSRDFFCNLAIIAITPGMYPEIIWA